jgi:hypothetical protein
MGTFARMPPSLFLIRPMPLTFPFLDILPPISRTFPGSFRAPRKSTLPWRLTRFERRLAKDSQSYHPLQKADHPPKATKGNIHFRKPPAQSMRHRRLWTAAILCSFRWQAEPRRASNTTRHPPLPTATKGNKSYHPLQAFPVAPQSTFHLPRFTPI